MKTLYVSDLDGTLFNSQKNISAYSADIINQCLAKGMQFTVATARMPYGCDYRLDMLHLSTPAILTNGVFLYTFETKSFISVESIDPGAVPQVIDAFKSNGASCFLYTYADGGVSIYFDDESLKAQTQYYSDRALESCREIAVVDDYMSKAVNTAVVYVALTGTEAELSPIRDSLEGIPGVSYAYYLNIYNGLYCIEVFSAKASKKNALKKLKELIRFDELVVFGDNLNDLSMIEVAQRSYAPSNALPEVKERVTEVLESSDDDGVAKFLAREWQV